ncbi:MAG: 30S ribosomal protein S9 [Candidatus Micrarchaeota archaeon]
MVKEEKKTAKPRTKKVKKATEHKEAHHEKHEHKEPPHEVKHEHKEAHHEKHEPKEVHHEKVPETKKVTKSKKKKPPKKPQRKVFVTRGKRKESVARATISEGKGVIRINSQNIDSINNHYIKEIIREPMRYVGPEANNIDIAVNVNGGGVMGQAQAARTAIANALVAYFDGMNLKEKFISIDRSLIIDDTRRVETKKFRGPKARARFQKSYR